MDDELNSLLSLRVVQLHVGQQQLDEDVNFMDDKLNSLFSLCLQLHGRQPQLGIMQLIEPQVRQSVQLHWPQQLDEDPLTVA